MTVAILPADLGIPRSTVDSMMVWLISLREDWNGEIPTRIHESSRGASWGLGSAPPFAPEFIAFVGRLECQNTECSQCRRSRRDPPPNRNNESRQRTTKAFRKLRMHAPREYDALQLVCLQGLTIEAAAVRFTEQAAAKGKLETYTAQGMALLVLSGLDKVSLWW